MIAHLSYVMCDDCGNPSEAVPEGAKEARRVAERRDHFKRIGRGRDSVDLCPRCFAKRAEEAA